MSNSMRVLMLGPDLRVRGGVSAVENALISSMPPEIEVSQLPTMVEGSKWRKTATFAQAIVRTIAALRREPDIVHIHFASRGSSVRKMLLARIALAQGCRVVMHAHGGGYRDYWASLSPSARAAKARTLSRVHCLIVLGETWREFFVSAGVPRERIVVLPNPVQLPSVVPKRLGRSHVRLVFLGLLARAKGVFDLVDALTRLSPECLGRTRLVLAGNGDVQGLRDFVERRGLTRFVEVRDWIGPQERDRLLASADAFVLPSYIEGLPMSLLESMAWGLPVISTTVGSIPEYVRDGVQGLLVQPGDVSELAGAIERIVMDSALRSRMGELGRRTVEPLNIDLYARKIVAIYDSISRTGSIAIAGEACTRS